MIRFLSIFLELALVAVLLTPTAVASDWAEGRGPTRDGVSTEKAFANEVVTRW